MRSNSIVERVADVVDVTGDNDQKQRLSRDNTFPARQARKFHVSWNAPEAQLIREELSDLLCRSCRTRTVKPRQPEADLVRLREERQWHGAAGEADYRRVTEP